MEECEYVIHRHKMNRSQLRQLRNMPYFDDDAIRSAIQMGPNYVEKDFERMGMKAVTYEHTKSS